MTLTTPTTPSRVDLPAVHATVSPADELVDARRTLYRVAAELFGLGPALTDDVLDNPTTRGRLGRALASGDPTGCADPATVGAVVTDDAWLDAGPMMLPVASAADANELLADALAAFAAELTRQTTDGESLRLLTAADGERFGEAMTHVRAGVALARTVNAELVDDLLVHVALLGIVDPEGAEPLASASSRAYPGLVLLGLPGSALEVAEGLVHEAAHQKLFDFAITGSMLTHESDRCPPFEPTWPPLGRRWPMEQALAAGHAYACLARFAADLGSEQACVGPASLLPAAPDRARTIGAWLLDHRPWLGPDAGTLLDGLFGGAELPGEPTAEPPARPAPILPEDGVGRFVLDPDLTLRRCELSDRAVLGKRTRPFDLFVIPGEAATLLELFDRERDGEAVDKFASAHNLSTAEARTRISELISEMVAMGVARRQVDH